MDEERKNQSEQWSKKYGRTITETEYAEICHNLSTFFNTIKEWDDVERKSCENEQYSDNGNKYLPCQT